MFGAVALSAAALLLGSVSGQAASRPPAAKCSSGKVKCASDKATGLLGCYGNAEGEGVAVDPLCTGKVVTRFADPVQGCMAKAESKPPCVTTGDTSDLETTVDDFVNDIVSIIDAGNPTPPVSKCAAHQKKCVANKVKAELGCYGKAASSGTPLDPLCLAKAETKFADPVKGCMAKLELNEPNDCITTGLTATLDGKVDTFSLDVFSDEVLGPPPSLLDFTFETGGGVCGAALDASNAVLAALHCGGIDSGGGASNHFEEAPWPDGTTNRFALSCAGGSCTVGATSTAPAANSADPDCTDTGCNFGAPLEIPNAIFPSISSCVKNTYASPASGTLDRVGGTTSLNTDLISAIFVTGNVAEPCPRCRSGGVPVHGGPSAPATGTCDGGPNSGMACTSVNSIGLTRDCPTGGTAAPPINVNFSPLTTLTASKSDPAGDFCPLQGTATFGASGCFAKPTCVTIAESGVASGPVSTGFDLNATLASVFCIPATGAFPVDAGGDLPGPGAVTLTGTVNAHN
jgi:hypothetical protein